MLFFKRRRLVFWLFKAYLKRLRKTILISFILGLLVFFILRFGVNYFIPLLPFTQTQTVGIVGAYTVDQLPSVISTKISRGLTKLDAQKKVVPDMAKNWEIKNDGKTYIFHLKDNIQFSNGTKLTSEQVKYNFIDVSTERPNPQTIVFNLKDKYSPFLVTVSRPVYINGLTGVGDYRVQAINLNGNFIQSINLVSVKHDNKEISYQFYPTEIALKTAYILGEVNSILGVEDPSFRNQKISSFNNTISDKRINYSQLVTLFYNNQDRVLSDKRLREALSYMMPNSFSEGERNFGPFVPNSWVNQNNLTSFQQDFDHANLLLKESQTSSSSASLNLTIKTLPQYEEVAEDIKSLWAKAGIKTKIETVEVFPTQFQIFLGEFNVPRDPDQYSLWHSSQRDNISNYKNLRIDKLLEDGRQTVDINERKKIYADFQKYLLDDSPATFLYFPYVYDIRRK